MQVQLQLHSMQMQLQLHWMQVMHLQLNWNQVHLQQQQQLVLGRPPLQVAAEVGCSQRPVYGV